MAMGRPRKKGRRDLPEGLYQDANGWKVRHPITGRFARLPTRDKAEALRIYAQLVATWADSVADTRAQATADRLRSAGHGGLRFTGWCREYRERVLPTATGKGVKPLAAKTRADYDRMLRNQVETSEALAVPLETVTSTTLRGFLAQWLSNPSQYNYTLALLVKVCKQAVDEGKLAVNPAKGIDRRPVARRETYIEDAHYSAIVSRIERDVSAWDAALVDWIYLVSHNPVDCLRVREEDIAEGVLRIARNKTTEAVDIEVAGDLEELVRYFRQVKAEQGILSPYLIVHPTTADRRLIGKPVKPEYVSRKWAAAAKAEGFGGVYELRDVRPKGLTDEARIAGAPTDKGAHATEAMKRHYVRVMLPKRAACRIRRIR